jgi:hypothetical protein
MMNKAPVRWMNGTWDYGEKVNIGYDAIPTIHDASISGYVDWESGIGWGYDLYLSTLELSDDKTMYVGVTKPSGNSWLPNVDTGYFYIDQDEYYLYADKGTTTGTPTVSGLSSSPPALSSKNHRYPPPPSPVVLTLGSSEFTSLEPFAKTYEPTYSRSSNKYRRRADLTGRREYMVSGNVVDGIVPVPYAFTLGNMQFTVGSSGTIGGTWNWYIQCNPYNIAVTAEYERSDSRVYSVVDVDMNPMNSYEVANSFIALLDTDTLVADSVVLNNGSRYIRENGKPNLLIAVVKDKYGVPIEGATVTFTCSWGTLSDSTVDTIWDGTAATWLTPTSINVTGVVTATCNGKTGSLWLPGGKI